MPADALPTDLLEAYDLCDRVARRDKPHLHAAAQYFTSPETRRAFAATYASMRFIDDFVDNIPNRSALSEHTRRVAAQTVEKWLVLVRDARSGQPGPGPVWRALSDTFARFELPLEPWEDLARAMESDLYAAMFRDWNHLRQYMNGASVAPAVVFMHLVMMQPNGRGGRFENPWSHAKVAGATEDLAIFCYWVHILRDVANDLAVGRTGLVYLPQADLDAFDLCVDDLHHMKETGRATESYIRLARFEAHRARVHLERGKVHLREVLGVVPPENARSLTTLVDTYVALLDNLAEHDFDVFARSLELTEEQRAQILPL